MSSQAKDGRRRRLNQVSQGLGLGLAPLESRLLLTASTISGYVYHDVTSDGAFGAGDRPIAGSSIQLLNAAKAVVGSTTTDASGRYEFATDGTVQAQPQTSSQSVAFPTTATNFTKSASATQFDPALGQLTSVDLTFNGTLTSRIQVESRDATPTTINGRVEGTLTAQAPGAVDLTLRPTSALSFDATAFDGVADFAGTSGKDFGAVSADDSKTVTLTTPDDLARYIGTGTVPLSVSAASSSAASGPGNLQSEITSDASAAINVVYHYLPHSDLKPGRYTIVQTAQPEGFLQGVNSRGGAAVPKNTPVDTIPVTLAADSLSDNNFGEVRQNSLSGFVYLDHNNNGGKDANEFGVATVRLRLQGRDDTNHPVSLSAQSDANGFYQFSGIRPGKYMIRQTQPAPFVSGQESVGSLGGQAGRNRFTNIVVKPDAQGVDYNFGERARPNCTLAVNLSRAERGLPLRGSLGPNVRRFLPGLVVYSSEHPRRA